MIAIECNHNDVVVVVALVRNVDVGSLVESVAVALFGECTVESHSSLEAEHLILHCASHFVHLVQD